jgi:solute carrier family 4 (anion exchanger) protein 1
MAEEGLVRFPGIFGGLVDDYRRRFGRHFIADYTTFFDHAGKALAAAVFIWLATLFSTVALAGVIEDNTDGRVGLSEYLLVNSVAGMVNALAGAQPLVVLRPTGPITAIVSDLAQIADTFDVDFYELLAATGILTATCMMIIVAFELSRFIGKLTPWSVDVFTCYVCSIYMFDAIKGEVDRFLEEDASQSTYVDTSFAVLTFAISMLLHYRGKAMFASLPPTVAFLLSEYAVFIGVVVSTAVSYAPTSYAVERISLPDTFALTNPSRPLVVEFTQDYNGELERTWGIAALVAVLITLFFYVDQNLSSLMCQLGLGRGLYFHGAFFAMASFNFIGPCLGLPFVTGSLPHSPQLSRHLMLEDEDADDAKKAPSNEAPKARFAENRITPLLAYALIGLPLLVPSLLNAIPTATMNGVLLFVGVEGVLSTQLSDRLRLLLYAAFCGGAEVMSGPFIDAGVSPQLITTYTFSQLGMWVLCASFFVAGQVSGLSVDLVVGVLIVCVVHPVRVYVVASRISASDLAALDTLRPPSHATRTTPGKPTEGTKLLSKK